MTLSIRWKVTLGTLLAVMLGLAVAGGLAFRSIEQLELARAEEALASRTGLAALALRPLLDRPPLPSDRLQAQAREIGLQANARVTVIAEDGRVLADSALSEEAIATLDNHRTRPEVANALAAGRGTDIRRSDTTGQRLFYLSLRVTAPDTRAVHVVRLAMPLTTLESRIRDLQQALGIAFGVAFAVSVLLSFFIARGLTRPLSDIAAVARQLAGGSFERRIPAASNDEVGVLATTLNQMADQLDHDITALRKLETVRKDFVANVSHELRTPLTSIKGYVEALLEGAKDHPEEATRFLHIILKQSDRLNLILEDLLQLSQIESGRVQFRQDPVDLRGVVDRTLASIKPLAEKKQQTLSVAIPQDAPPVTGDEDRLVQVLTNLLDNAVKYSPEGGTIDVTTRPARGDAAIELTVADNGIGIPEADRPRVFERFYRVDKARSREMGGTGLGLAIVKHIVEGHGGQVWVEGNEPTGSRFIIRLPIAKPVPGTPHPTRDTTA
ncbi:MAG: HAMP domain-containing protein [Nitrospirota bacterium]|nr:HAMP domain-containing protein [Nitrospirota bacterium]MDE3035267.1 HAMP domain-containing protein [Nitrospirota bacterium]MDE3225310.1 HAMP domain-containing protein [Nitrospirota bacterium]MDE3243634.1 HAMP domain-containing protein [Nitrospirota bacterium]